MSQRLRIGVDIGGTFTDVTVLDPGDGSVAFGKALWTPDDLVGGILDAIERPGRARGRGVHHSRLDRRDQRDPRTQGRADRAGHDRRLSRRLRDRPHQPARFVQPLLPQARAARFRATASSRLPNACSLRRLGLAAARRGGARARRAASCATQDVEGGRGDVSALVRQRRRTNGGWSRSCAKRCPSVVHHRLARRLARAARIRAHLDDGGQRLRRPARERAISSGSKRGLHATASTATC